MYVNKHKYNTYLTFNDPQQYAIVCGYNCIKVLNDLNMIFRNATYWMEEEWYHHLTQGFEGQLFPLEMVRRTQIKYIQPICLKKLATYKNQKHFWLYH